MRLITKTQDYYDSAIAHGVDSTIIFNRQAMEYGWEPETRPGYLGYRPLSKQALPIQIGAAMIKIIGDDGSQSTSKYSHFGYGHVNAYQHGYVAFCGTLYPFIVTGKQIPSKYLNKGGYPETQHIEYTYHYSSTDEMVELYCGKWDDRKSDRVNQERRSYHKNTLAAFFQPRVVGGDPFRQLQAPYFYGSTGGTSHYGTQRDKVFVNASLKDVQFFKVKDAYTAFQDISFFLSNDLVEMQSADQPNRTEKQFVQAKGFDAKYGFRTRPH